MLDRPDAQYVENFTWIPKRNTLDIEKPYSSENVSGIEIDFFDFESEKYDFATCLQVLEHIPDAKSFAGKLFQTAHRVLISVPYMWDESRAPSHVHDPVDLDKLYDWTWSRTKLSRHSDGTSCRSECRPKAYMLLPSRR